MIRIVIPGWAMPPALYAALNPDVVFDYGFFPGSIESADASFDVFPLDSTDPAAVMTFAPPKQPYEMVAHSMGALAALARSPLRDNAERVVILGGFAKFAKSSDNPLGVPIVDIATLAETLKASPEKLLKRFSRLTAFPEKFKFPPSPSRIDTGKLLEGLETLRDADVRGDLDSLKIPAVFAHGESDAVAPLELARETAARISGAEFKSLPNVGHAIPFTKSAMLAD